jgi:hypothetical protein
MPKKKSWIKYPGWLGKPIPQTAEFFEALLSGRPQAIDLWLVDQQDKTLQGLLQHYKIPTGTAVDRWYLLAWRLALDHVPAMQVRHTQGPGRPGAALFASAERALAGLDSMPRKRGRPKKWDDELRLALVESIDEIKSAAAARGERISDNAALEDLLKEKARRHGMAVLKVARENKSKVFTRWRKQLQIARKKIPRNSGA